MNLNQAESEIALLAAYEYRDREELIGAVHTLKNITNALRRNASDFEQSDRVELVLAVADALALDLGALAGILPVLPLPLFGDLVPDRDELSN